MVLTRSQIDALINVGDVLTLLREGFQAATTSPTPLRIRTDLPGPGTATCLMPGLLPGIPAYAVKVNAKFPDAVPALRGVVCLHDLHTGELLALADSASLTAWRTGLAAALATHTLAHPDTDLVCSTGALGNANLGATAAAGTLTDVLRGDLPAHDDARVSVYAPVGLPWQDLALLWWLHQHANAAHITTIDLLS